jgi:hypothetical protein
MATTVGYVSHSVYTSICISRFFLTAFRSNTNTKEGCLFCREDTGNLFPRCDVHEFDSKSVYFRFLFPYKEGSRPSLIYTTLQGRFMLVLIVSILEIVAYEIQTNLGLESIGFWILSIIRYYKI